MKIAQISATFPPYLGGTGSVCYYYSIGLAKLGHKVDVITSNFPNIQYNYPQAIQVFRYQPIIRIGNAPMIIQLFTVKEYDILHIHYPFFMGDLFTFIASRIKNQKMIVTYHNDVILKGWIGKFSDLYNLIVQRFILMRANKIIFTSMDYALNSKVSGIVERRKNDVIEIPNGVDITRFNPDIDGSEIKTKLNLKNEVTYLFVGALDKAHFFKGVNCLLESFEKIKTDNKRLLIIGDGDLKETYVSKAGLLKILDKVQFLGRISDSELPKYYSAADVIILPSTTMGEAFGVVLLEAMACGKPVIASNLPGVRSVVTNGETGFLVKPNDPLDLTEKMSILLSDNTRRKKFGKNGRKKVEEKYQWQTIVQILESCYFEVSP